MDPEEDFLFVPTLVRNVEETHYEIFAVPIEELGRVRGPTNLPKPKIILKFFEKLCVVGSVVYLFSSDKAVGTLNLSSVLRRSSDQEEVVFADDMIKYISSMKCEKRCVEAIPTPSKKVLAFSRSISLGSCFELYDPDKGCWEDLPQIERNLDSARHLSEIESYSFINNDTFVVQVPSGKTYQLKMDGPTNEFCWQICVWSDGSSPLRGFPRPILGGGFELCLSSDAVWDIDNVSRVHKPVFCFPSPIEPVSRMIISRGRWSCCYVMDIAKKSGVHYLLIQEYDMQVAKYFEKKKEHEEKFFKDTKSLKEMKEDDLEKKFFDDLEKLERMAWNRLNVSYPPLECFLLRDSMFYIGRSHSLSYETTFSI